MLIRLAQSEDLPQLVHFWLEKQQLAPLTKTTRLDSAGRQAWLAARATNLADAAWRMFVVLDDEAVCGYILGVRQVHPVWGVVGWVQECVFDVHRGRSGGAGRLLWQALRDSWQAHGIGRACIRQVPALAVEQAFWRSLGAVKEDNLWWITWSFDG